MIQPILSTKRKRKLSEYQPHNYALSIAEKKLARSSPNEGINQLKFTFKPTCATCVTPGKTADRIGSSDRFRKIINNT